MRRLFLAAALASLIAPASAQSPQTGGPTNQSNLALIAPTAPTADSSDRIATTAWVNNLVNAGLPLASGKIWIGSVGNIATAQTPSGDLTVSNAGVFTFGTVNANVGSFGSATQCASVTINAKGLVTAASQNVCTPAIASVTGLGTGVGAALAINIGSAGAPVLFNGAGGTPASMVGTNITGVPIGTGVSGLGAGCATFLGTPSSANLRGCLTDESGPGLAYFQGGDIGTPSAGVGTNFSGTAASLTAGNATKLATPRAIGIGGTTGLTATGVNFDGTAAINPALTGTLAVANGGTGDTGTAWTTYTPSASCGTATFTTNAARFKTIGKTVFFNIDVTITAIGTCTTNIIFNLPATSNSSGGLSGRESVVTAKAVACAFTGSSTTAACSLADATNFAVTARVAMSGVYESQ